ncbi:MAG: c-type cytochrome domain-containing protein, partial [Verrucomicrobiota bacterium]
MSNIVRIFVTTVLISVGAGSTAAEVNPTQFLKTYCVSCHGPDEQKGDRRFDEIAFPLAGKAELIEIQDAID